MGGIGGLRQLIMRQRQKSWQELKRLSAGCIAKNDPPRAVAYLERAIEAARAHNTSELALMYNGLAKLCLQRGDLLSAENAARKSINQELEFGACSSETTNLASYYMMLGEILEKQTRFSEAARYVEQGVNIFARHFRQDDPFFQNLLAYQRSITENLWRG